MNSTRVKWYYEIGGDRLGPYSKAEIENRKRSGLVPTDVKIYERRLKNSGGSWIRRWMKLIKMDERDLQVLLGVLVVTIIIVGLILILTY